MFNNGFSIGVINCCVVCNLLRLLVIEIIFRERMIDGVSFSVKRKLFLVFVLFVLWNEVVVLFVLGSCLNDLFRMEKLKMCY